MCQLKNSKIPHSKKSNKSTYKKPYNKFNQRKKTYNNDNTNQNIENQPQENKTSSELYSKNYKHEDNTTIQNQTSLNINEKPFYSKNYRKYSKDLSADSTSNEDKDEKIINKSNKLPYKSNANDFKIKYKTELCKYYEINGFCKFGDNCAYAHGKENLRSKVTNSTAYRSKKCVQFYTYGFCPYGNRCQFAHALKTNIINNPYDKNMSYTKTMETLSKLENVENIKTLFEKPRLKIFESFAPNVENTKSELFDDIKSLTYENNEIYC